MRGEAFRAIGTADASRAASLSGRGSCARIAGVISAGAAGKSRARAGHGGGRLGGESVGRDHGGGLMRRGSCAALGGGPWRASLGAALGGGPWGAILGAGSRGAILQPGTGQGGRRGGGRMGGRAHGATGPRGPRGRPWGPSAGAKGGRYNGRPVVCVCRVVVVISQPAAHCAAQCAKG